MVRKSVEHHRYGLRAITLNSIPVDDLDALRQALNDTEALLLDFDGPICSVFSSIPAKYIAEQLRRILRDSARINLPIDIQVTVDPFDVFRYAATISDDEAHKIERALTEYETKAIAAARATVGSNELIRHWHDSGKSLAVVSNNSRSAIDSYLSAAEISNCVSFVSARDSHDPALLKPNPHKVTLAVKHLRVDPSRCALLGDSPSDVVAARASRVHSIAYAKRKSAILPLSQAEPDLIVTSIEIVKQSVLSL
ncbi:HAD hydrolase-like protein [Actinosynnema sp. NPDC023794]